MEKAALFFLSLLIAITTFVQSNQYTLVVEGFDWGPNASDFLVKVNDQPVSLMEWLAAQQN